MKIWSLLLCIGLIGLGCSVRDQRAKAIQERKPTTGTDSLEPTALELAVKICNAFSLKHQTVAKWPEAERVFHFNLSIKSCASPEPERKTITMKIDENTGDSSIKLIWTPIGYSGRYLQNELTTTDGPLAPFCAGFMSGSNNTKVRDLESGNRAVVTFSKVKEFPAFQVDVYRKDSNEKFVWFYSDNSVVRVLPAPRNAHNGLVLERTFSKDCLGSNEKEIVSQKIVDELP